MTDHARITRRGIQLYQLAVLMEIGYGGRGQGAEALLYMADAIARLAALSTEPRTALATVTSLFSKIQDDWFEQQRSEHGDRHLPDASHLISDITFETVVGQKDPNEALGGFAVDALERLTDALVDIARLNKNPRNIIEHVMRRLDEADTSPGDVSRTTRVEDLS